MFLSVLLKLVFQPVIGGMPMVTISDFFMMRLQLISVFLLGMVVSSLVVKKVWNNFRNDLPALPELTLGKSFALVTLWGLLFVIVLTMISGARELMTPGAWVKKGNTYVLPSSLNPTSTELRTQLLQEQRIRHLKLIHNILLDETLKLEELPHRKEEVSLPKRLWVVPETHSLEYIYVPSLLSVENSQAILAEPEFFEDGRFVLWQDGRVELIPPGNPMPYKQNGGEQP